eukprot:gnl/TRDRNA2_/TRDRNA2_176840_c2_seq2.p1 gnl/TRDRNA2_/TRDRNA2_176840_c2~~gnl/TRDRNA2_/TRDRNA2_176840_c2_seq2.p1  ORF type:complete len:677 (+),score=148.32 gnl/TRDRNA2_/TRDRNA2_176840_c2_seq2:197-2032(+)
MEVAALPTSTKWSVLSSRIEGLAQEMCQVVSGMDAYCVSVSNAEGPAMTAVREKMLTTAWAEEWENKRTMFSYGEEMSTDPLEAMMLKQFVHMARPKRILEVGMFVGFGAVAMMEGSPSSKVVSLEIDPYLKTWLSDCLQKFPDILKRHEVVVGPALESLEKLTGQFDMVFVDANKSEYKRYVEVMLKRDLIAPDGTIVCDNVLYNGYPYLDSHFDAQPARRAFGNDIRVFNKWVSEHPELEQVVLPIRDGVSILRKKPSLSFKPQPRSDSTIQQTSAATPAVCSENQLLSLKSSTSVVADTGDLVQLKKFTPEDATTNPTLLLAAVQMPEYKSIVDKAIAAGKAAAGAGAEKDAIVEEVCDQLAVGFGIEILKLVKGYVSTELNANLSFNTEESIKQARKIISMYEKAGFDRSRILIKMGSTWESIRACEVLEKEGIKCNMTLLFSFCQAVACAEAGATLISPFVGRILDWYKKANPDKAKEYDSNPETDPGVISVKKIYKYYRKHGYKTIVMGASFRNKGEITALAGCDKLTIGPKFLEELEKSEGAVTRKLSPDMDLSDAVAKKETMSEMVFKWELNEDAMGTEKLSEGIRNFNKDFLKLKDLIAGKI